MTRKTRRTRKIGPRVGRLGRFGRFGRLSHSDESDESDDDDPDDSDDCWLQARWSRLLVKMSMKRRCEWQQISESKKILMIGFGHGLDM